MNKIKNQRNASIDLLRIISMGGVIVLHASNYGLDFGLLNSEEYANNSFTSLTFVLVAFTAVAVNVFFMLSGYFHSRFRISKLVELIIEATVYSLTGYIICCCVGSTNFDVKTLLSRGIFGWASYWFLTVYIIIYCFSDYINKFLDTLSDDELKHLVVIYFVVNTIFGFMLDRSNYGSAFSVLPMLFVYTLGYSISRYHQSAHVRNISNSERGIIILLYCIISIVIAFAGLVFFRTNHQQLAYRIMTDYRNPALIISAYLLMLFFTEGIHIKSSKTVTFFAIHIFAVYLLTDSADVRVFIWKPIAYIFENYNSALILLMIIFAYVIALMCICILIDYIRKQIYSGLEKRLLTLYNGYKGRHRGI